MFLKGFKKRVVVHQLLANEGHKQIAITDPQDKLLYGEIMLFALKSLKRRHGFDAEDCAFYLAAKGVTTNVDVVQQALALFTISGILEEFYSSERKKNIYRLH